MKLLGIKLECVQKHTPEDNGDIESFHKSIKTDYNERRPHSFIDYLPPKEFRKRFLDDPAFRERFEIKQVEVRLNENCVKLFQILVERIKKLKKT